MTWMVETYSALRPPRWTMIAHTGGGGGEGAPAGEAGADVAAFNTAIRLAKEGQTEAALGMLQNAVAWRTR